MVSHNAAFVKEFMEYEFKFRDLDGFLTYFCTWEMAKKVFPSEKNSIHELVKRLGFDEVSLAGHYRSDSQKVFFVYESFKNLHS